VGGEGEQEAESEQDGKEKVGGEWVFRDVGGQGIILL